MRDCVLADYDDVVHGKGLVWGVLPVLGATYSCPVHAQAGMSGLGLL